MLLRWTTVVALTALLWACAPTMLPQADAQKDETSSADGIDGDVSSLPDVVSMDSAPDALPDAAPDGPVACTLPLQEPLAEPTVDRPTMVVGTWTATGASNSVTTFSCTNFGHGDDHIYPFTVSARTTFQFVVWKEGGTLANPMLAIRRACASEVNEVACDLDSGWATSGAARVTLDPGLYYVFASEHATSSSVVRGGAYRITVTVPVEAPNAHCASATTWMAGTSFFVNSDTGGTTDRSCNSTTTGSPEVFYRYVVPPNTAAGITASPMGTYSFRAHVLVREDCASTSCLSYNSSSTEGVSTSTGVINRTNIARTFIVSVSSHDIGVGGITLSDHLETLPPTPDNAYCATPTMLPLIATLTMQTTVGAFEKRSSSTCGSVDTTGGPLAYYSMNVPAGRTITVTVTPSPTFDPTIRIFAGCSPTTCGAYRNSFSTGVVEQAAYRNATAMDQTVIIAVGSSSEVATGTFDLSVR